MSKTIAKGLFYLVAIVLIAWTASLTMSFLRIALPGAAWYVPILGLVIFDAGMISWLYVFLLYAQGMIQRATAIVLCLFNFVGVGLLVLSEVLLGGQQLTEAPADLGTYAVWGIAIWTVMNVLGVLVFHLGDPESQKAMAFQAEKDAIWSDAQKVLKQRRIGMSQELAAQLGDRLFSELLAELAVDVNQNGTPDILEPGKQSPPKLSAGSQDTLHNDNPRIIASETGNGNWPYMTGNTIHPRYDWQSQEWNELYKNFQARRALATENERDTVTGEFLREKTDMVRRWEDSDRHGTNAANPTQRPK